MKTKDIAIVGMSCYAPGASNMDEYWNNLVNGVDSITDAPADRIDPRYFDNSTPAIDRFYCKRGGFVPDITFDPVKYSLLPVAVEGMDSVHLLALKMVYHALEDAKVFEKKISLNRGALIIGKGNYVGSAIWRAMDVVHVGEQIAEVMKNAFPDMPEEEIIKIKKEYQASRGRYQADSMPGLIPNLIASLIANKLDMQGPAYTIDAACASSLIALEHCVNELSSGRCDIAIAGGVHAGQNATFWSIFTQLGALSNKQQITPFSEDADGLLIGEGGGFVVLKTLDKALADNDRIYSVIKGVGVSSDGGGVSVLAPSAKGQKLAIKEAWEKTGMDTRKLGYVEAHGTATVIGDKTELASLAEIFPKEKGAEKVLIGSVKSNIGHAMPAAGILGLIKTSLALYNRQIPPTLHCEKPMKEMAETRFEPVQKLEKWDEAKYPLVAGVNAFGFGGINAHVILEAYGEKKVVERKKVPFKDRVVVISAPTKEALIASLKKGETSLKEGDYRVVLFDPTQERIEKAIKLISKDKPWKGRQDIWFSNEPLLKNGGKVAFMYPGFDPSSNPEIESLASHFGYSVHEDQAGNNPMVNHTLKLYRCSEAMNQALDYVGLKADMNLGHSLGEWFGAKASGMVSDSSVIKLIESTDPSKYSIDGIYFVAVSVGREKMDELFGNIPDLYLANDNCPNQILLCGTQEAVDKLIPILQREQIFYQQLTFQSGFHTPFIKDQLHLLEDSFKILDFKDADIPMWSCNTLGVYPKKPQDIKALSAKHLIEPVRFRDLIDKLYNKENVRAFVQIGAGSLVGFVDDTLAGKAYSAVSTVAHHKTSLEQLRRVMALLYIEGKEVDLDFLGINIKAEENKSSGREMKMKMCMDIVKEFPLVSQYRSKYGAKSVDLSSLSVDTTHPVAQALNENLREMALMQTEIVKLFQTRGMLNNSGVRPVQAMTTTMPAPQIPQMPQVPVVEKEQKTGKAIEEDLYVSLDTHPTIIGHSLVKQPSYWKCAEDLNPVIPMTMTFELLAEAAHKQDPSKKIAKLGPVSVFQWMEVHKPFEKKIEGVWKSEDVISLGIKGFANGEVTLLDEYPTPDPFYVNEIDLGEDFRKFPTKEEIYEKYMFHGVEYQGIERVANVTEKGIRTYIRKGPGKGSLLDNMGQTYGLYMHLILDVNFITFPVKVQEITFYQDMHDQEGLFECICLSKTITDEFTSCEMVLKREGKLWCVIKGWQNRRFEFDDLLWQITLNPGRNLLAKEIAPNVFYFNNAYEKASVWTFLSRRYLNQPEKQRLEKTPLNKRKDYMISRVALKDSLRSYVQNKYDKATYPIEYFVKYDSFNKPSVYGIDEVEGVEISLAHKGTDSVSIVSEKPVGIDIESIEERSADFMDMAFTSAEQELLKGKDIAEWSTRFWVAKEAYGKMLGKGLQGNPKAYEVKAINGEKLAIEDCTIETMKHKNFIIGWTQ
jgi:3-oxoacyl-(acyl-carrier-protein) synthase/phosphopantetheinyl transferase/malonyl CoA-acyl carrier protein transacylase